MEKNEIRCVAESMLEPTFIFTLQKINDVTQITPSRPTSSTTLSSSIDNTTLEPENPQMMSSSIRDLRKRLRQIIDTLKRGLVGKIILENIKLRNGVESAAECSSSQPGIMSPHPPKKLRETDGSPRATFASTLSGSFSTLLSSVFVSEIKYLDPDFGVMCLLTDAAFSDVVITQKVPLPFLYAENTPPINILLACGINEIRVLYELAERTPLSKNELSQANNGENSVPEAPLPTARARALTQPPLRPEVLAIDEPLKPIIASKAGSYTYCQRTARKQKDCPSYPLPLEEFEVMEEIEPQASLSLSHRRATAGIKEEGFDALTGTTTVAGSRVVFYGEMKPNLHEPKEASISHSYSHHSNNLARKSTLNTFSSPVELRDEDFMLATSVNADNPPLLSTATAFFSPAHQSDSDVDAPTLKHVGRRCTIAPTDERHRSFFRGSTTNHQRPITPAEIQTVMLLSDDSMEVPDEVRELQAMWKRIEVEEREESEKLKRIVPWIIPLAKPDVDGYSLAESTFFKSYIERNKITSPSLSSSSQMSSFTSDGLLSPNNSLAKLWKAAGRSGIVRRSSALSIETPSLGSSTFTMRAK